MQQVGSELWPVFVILKQLAAVAGVGLHFDAAKDLT